MKNLTKLSLIAAALAASTTAIAAPKTFVYCLEVPLPHLARLLARMEQVLILHHAQSITN